MFYPVILGLLLFFLVFLQATFIPIFTDLSPNLFLITFLTICWVGEENKALWTAFFGGAFYDFLTVRPIGIRSLALLLVAVSIISIRRLTDSLFSRFLIVFFISLGWHLYPNFLIDERMFLPAFSDALVFTILFSPLSAFFRRLFWEEDLQLSFKDKLR